MKIQIKDFQSVAEAELVVEPREFVCIVGKSDIGKSALFRAVAGLMTNCAIGGEVRKGQKDVSVSIRENDTEVIWEKGKTKHQFTIAKDGQEDKVLEKTGGNVPEEVRALGFDLVRTQYGEYNLVMRGQHDPIFLNADPRGTADLISKLGQLDRLSKAVDLCSADLKRDRREIDQLEKSKKELDEKLEIYKDVDDIEKKVEALQQLTQQLEETEEKIRWIENAVQQREQLQTRVKVLESRDFSALTKIEDLVAKAGTIQEKIGWIAKAVQRKETLSISIRRLERRGRVLEKIPQKNFTVLEKVGRVLEVLGQFTARKLAAVTGIRTFETRLQVLSRVGQVEKSFQELKEEAERVESLSWYRSKRTLANGALIEWQGQLERIEGELQQAREERAKFKVCPLCGNNLK